MRVLLRSGPFGRAGFNSHPGLDRWLRFLEYDEIYEERVLALSHSGNPAQIKWAGPASAMGRRKRVPQIAGLAAVDIGARWCLRLGLDTLSASPSHDIGERADLGIGSSDSVVEGVVGFRLRPSPAGAVCRSSKPEADFWRQAEGHQRP